MAKKKPKEKPIMRAVPVTGPARTRMLIDGAVRETITDAAIELAAEVNKLQIDIDRYVLSQRGMSIPGMRAAIFGEESTLVSSRVASMRKYIARLTDGAISDSWGKGMTERQAEAPDDTLYTWRTESAKPCPDCLRRNGQRRTLEEWELIGRPRSGFSVCGRNCKCILDSTGEGNFNRPKRGAKT